LLGRSASDERAARGAMNSLLAELLEGHIRSHVLNGKHKPSSQQVAAADEVIDIVKSYLDIWNNSVRSTERDLS
jgi:hypothetical protein